MMVNLENCCKMNHKVPVYAPNLKSAVQNGMYEQNRADKFDENVYDYDTDLEKE